MGGNTLLKAETRENGKVQLYEHNRDNYARSPFTMLALDHNGTPVHLRTEKDKLIIEGLDSGRLEFNITRID